MRLHRGVRAAAGVLGVVALAACTADEPTAGPTTPTTESATQDRGEQPDVADAGDRGPVGRLALSGWFQSSRSGVSVDLRAIEVDVAGTPFVEFQAVSGRDDVQLAGFDTFLLDDLGTRYDLVRVEDNPAADLPVDTLGTARFAFEGPVDPDATTVTFAVNAIGPRVRSADELRPGTTPPFAFEDVPLPGVGLEGSAAREEGLELARPRVVPLDLENIRDTGVSARLSEVRIDGRSAEFDMLVVNPTDAEQRLFVSAPRLEDDQGFTLRYEGHDEGRRRLEVPPNSEAELTLAFRGSVHPDAESLRLSIGNAGPESKWSPVFVFEDIPLRAGDGPTTGDTDQPESEQ